MQSFEEKTIHTESIYDGKIIQVQVDDVRLPDGKTAKRERVLHPGAVAVIPVTVDGNIIFVKQYRKPLEKTLVEIPAGKMEKGEMPETTARRELEEETGYTVDTLEWVTSFYTSPGFANELMYIYLARDVVKLDEMVAGDEDEFIEIKEMTLAEAQKCTENQHIHDAKTNFAVLYLQAFTDICKSLNNTDTTTKNN